MSRETTFKEGAWVGGYEYSTTAQLKEDIAKCEAELSGYKAQLYGLVCATPKDFMPEGEEPRYYFPQIYDEIFDDIQETAIRLANLYTIQLNEDYIEKGETP